MYPENCAQWLFRAILCCAVVFLPVAPAAAHPSGQTENKSAAAVASSSAPHPVLVELFTSEGCSSCPPADAFIEKMDSSQPIAGAQLIVLSEHVDYWDQQGWKDPNSSSAITERQIAYVHALQLKEPYTPQIIVDGTTELRANDQPQVRTVLQQAADQATVPVRIDEVRVDSGSPTVVRAHIEADNHSEQQHGDVYLAVALGRVESEVLRGENGGRRLSHVAVVQEFTKVGKLPKDKTFEKTVALKLKPGTDPKNVRIVAFVQEPGPGKVIGAAMWKAAN